MRKMRRKEFAIFASFVDDDDDIFTRSRQAGVNHLDGIFRSNEKEDSRGFVAFKTVDGTEFHHATVEVESKFLGSFNLPGMLREFDMFCHLDRFECCNGPLPTQSCLMMLGSFMTAL